jgi:hypothetical protein
MEYDNTNTGAVWKREASTNKHPNLTGKLDVDGEEYFISMWENKTPTKNAPQYQIKITNKNLIDFDDLPF